LLDAVQNIIFDGVSLNLLESPGSLRFLIASYGIARVAALIFNKHHQAERAKDARLHWLGV